MATTSALDKANYEVSPEKAGPALDQAKEALFDIRLKHVSLKQVIRFAFALESGARPVKVRNFSVDTKADPVGYMDASLAVSGFSIASSSPAGGGQ